MFSLQESSSYYEGSCSKTKDDNLNRYPERFTSLETKSSISDDSGISCDNNYALPIHQSSTNQTVFYNNDPSFDDLEENIELDLIGEQEDDEEEDSNYDRSITCYTPERLIKCSEFRILTSSPRSYPSFKTNVDTTLVETNSANIGAATSLIKLLQCLGISKQNCNPNSCCQIEYGNGEIFYKNCPTHVTSEFDRSCEEKNRQKIKDDRQFNETKKINDDESSGITSTGFTIRNDDDDENWSSYSSDKGEVAQLRNKSLEYAYSLLENKRPSYEDKKSHMGQIRNAKRSSYLNDTVVELSNVSLIPSETEIERLNTKVVQLHGNNMCLYEEILLLKKEFAIDECKIDHLSQDISKLHNEVHELRNLDDLLKLLKGELDRISKRNWPFNIGNVKSKINEINLVI